MKNTNTSKSACVPASLKFVALAACVLVPAGMLAETQSRFDDYGYNYAPDTLSEPVTPSLSDSISFKAFYGIGLTAPAKDMDRYYHDPEIDIGGLTVEYTKNITPNIDVVFAGSFGGGSCDYEDLGKLSLFTYEMEFGVNLRAPLGNSFALFAGPRVGMNMLYAEFDWDRRTRENDTDIGLLYGVDAGAVISFNERNALTLGIGYRASTARPECCLGEIKKQNWVRFSIGYQLSF